MLVELEEVEAVALAVPLQLAVELPVWVDVAVDEAVEVAVVVAVAVLVKVCVLVRVRVLDMERVRVGVCVTHNPPEQHGSSAFRSAGADARGVGRGVLPTH